MKIGIIGGGSVAQTLGAALIGKGHQVAIGIRSTSAAELARPRTYAATLADWQAKTGGQVLTLAEAAAFGEVIINASLGEASVAALTQAGAANLAGKVLIDVSNPLDFSRGMPPALLPAFSGHTSLGEQIQSAFPEARVVKAFNTIAAAVMVNPALVPGDHDLFLSGNDAAAKALVTDLARDFGWTHVTDLGDITGARASEAVLPFWVRLMMTGGSPIFNIHVTRA
jgi:predicted dinucleotide-binding enzyme